MRKDLRVMNTIIVMEDITSNKMSSWRAEARPCLWSLSLGYHRLSNRKKQNIHKTLVINSY